MNIFFRVGKWLEDRKSVKNLDYEQRIRLIETALAAQMKANQSMMIRVRKLEEFTKVYR